jgi:hypothetical protein
VTVCCPGTPAAKSSQEPSQFRYSSLSFHFLSQGRKDNHAVQKYQGFQRNIISGNSGKSTAWTPVNAKGRADETAHNHTE